MSAAHTNYCDEAKWMGWRTTKQISMERKNERTASTVQQQLINQMLAGGNLELFMKTKIAQIKKYLAKLLFLGKETKPTLIELRNA